MFNPGSAQQDVDDLLGGGDKTSENVQTPTVKEMVKTIQGHGTKNPNIEAPAPTMYGFDTSVLVPTNSSISPLSTNFTYQQGKLPYPINTVPHDNGDPHHMNVYMTQHNAFIQQQHELREQKMKTNELEKQLLEKKLRETQVQLEQLQQQHQQSNNSQNLLLPSAGRYSANGSAGYAHPSNTHPPNEVLTTREHQAGRGHHGNNHQHNGPQHGQSQTIDPRNTPEFTRITSGLSERIADPKSAHWTSVPIFWESASGKCQPGQGGGYWKWGDDAYVRLPHNPSNLIRGQNGGTAWEVISTQLQKLASACGKPGGLSKNVGTVMAAVVRNYCPDAHKTSNFGMLGRRDLEKDLLNTIPIIVDFALRLPALLGAPIPILKCGQSKTIYMSRKLCCSLLANAFFCTFPESSGHGSSQLPDVNFLRLYNDTNSDRCEVKKEKIKCILNYFAQFLAMDEECQNQIVSYERRCLSNKGDWSRYNKSLCDVRVELNAKIEDAGDMLQCDFANKVIGGGVLNDGSVMEEIRFCISPELIVSRLFTETMNDDEVVVITGAQVYNEYKGYSTTFKYVGSKANIHTSVVDHFGRTRTQLVAIDALSFKKHDANKQFQKNNIDRELHKCYVAFMHGKHRVTEVATGNWGCGAFNGNPELKFLIQWMAASQQDRQKIHYHTAGDQQQTKALIDVKNALHQKNVDVGQLYRAVLKFSGSHQNGSLFKYVIDNVSGGAGGISGLIPGRFKK